MSALHSLLLAVLVLIIATEAPAAPPEEEELAVVSISLIPRGWWIRVFPDGRVTCAYGSLPHHQINMPPGSVDFATLATKLRALTVDETIKGAPQVSFRRKGERSVRSKYISSDILLRRLFPNEPTAWCVLRSSTDAQGTKTYRQIPLSDEMRGLLLKKPIFPAKEAEQDEDDQAAAAVEPEP